MNNVDDIIVRARTVYQTTVDYAKTSKLVGTQKYIDEICNAEELLIDAEEKNDQSKAEEVITICNKFFRETKSEPANSANVSKNTKSKKTTDNIEALNVKTEKPAENTGDVEKPANEAPAEKTEKPAKKSTGKKNTKKTEKPAEKTDKPAEVKVIKGSAWDDVKDCKMNTNGNDSKSAVGKFIIEFGKKGEFTGEELAKAFITQFKTKTGITPDEKWARRNVLLFIQTGLIICEIEEA
jgi:hypothetical protein